MSSVINTNYLSLIAQNNLNKSQSSLTSAIQRLSSGLRINSAADDAAGQAIANRFTANINGLDQATRNANDGISIAQTTGGALDQINTNLQRIRALSVQAANGTNSASDLKSIQDEISQRLDEINRVAAQTQFNGVNVLASNRTLSVQVGANDSQTISIGLSAINSGTLGLSKLNVSDQIESSNLVAVQPNQTAAGATAVTFNNVNTQTYTVLVGNDGKLYAENNQTLAYYGASVNATGDQISIGAATSVTSNNFSYNASVYTNASGTSYQLSTLQSARIVPPSISATESLYQYQSVNGTAYEVKAGGTYYSATYDPVSGVATVDVSTATSAVPSFATGAAKVADGYTQVKVALATATTAAGYDLSKVNQALSANSANSLVRDTKTGSYYIKSVLNGQTSYYQAAMGTSTTGGTIHVISAMTNQVVVDPLASIDKAIAQVDNLRSGLGAMQNRFQSAIDNLSNTQTNLEASRSRIQDANYATEVSNMTKAQILQQAGTAVLAQANQVPQSILSLLR